MLFLSPSQQCQSSVDKNHIKAGIGYTKANRVLYHHMEGCNHVIYLFNTPNGSIQ